MLFKQKAVLSPLPRLKRLAGLLLEPLFFKAEESFHLELVETGQSEPCRTQPGKSEQHEPWGMAALM